jgi:hypothetical protein
MAETPNSVFYQIGQSPMGLVAVFSSRATGKSFPSGTTVVGVPNGFLATVVHGVANMPLVHCIQGMDAAQARQALDAAGFVERPKDMSQAAQAPKRWTPPTPASLRAPVSPTLLFTVGTRLAGPTGLVPITCAAIYADQESLEEWEELGPSYVPTAVMAAFRYDRRHGLVFSGNEAQARALLAGLGLTDGGGMPWHKPQDLAFGVADAEDWNGNPQPGDTHLFILPKDDHAPFFDDLRENHLQACPDFIDSTECENTWTIEGKTPQEVKDVLLALGYTHDPALDGESGG